MPSKKKPGNRWSDKRLVEVHCRKKDEPEEGGETRNESRKPIVREKISRGSQIGGGRTSKRLDSEKPRNKKRLKRAKC